MVIRLYPEQGYISATGHFRMTLPLFCTVKSNKMKSFISGKTTHRNRKSDLTTIARLLYEDVELVHLIHFTTYEKNTPGMQLVI